MTQSLYLGIRQLGDPYHIPSHTSVVLFWQVVSPYWVPLGLSFPICKHEDDKAHFTAIAKTKDAWYRAQTLHKRHPPIDVTRPPGIPVPSMETRTGKERWILGDMSKGVALMGIPSHGQSVGRGWLTSR